MSTKTLIYGGIAIIVLALGFFAYTEYFSKGGVGRDDLNTQVTPTNTSTKGTSSETDPATQVGKSLDLSNRSLTEIPESVFKDTQLVTLNISHNALAGAIPGEIRFLTALRALDMSNNMLTGVPAEIGQLRALEYLNLSHNPLTGLPYELGNLKNLKELDLRGTDYAKQDLAKIREGLRPDVLIRVDE